MNDTDAKLEQRLRAVFERDHRVAGPAPADLRAAIVAIPSTTPRDTRVSRQRGLTLLTAAGLGVAIVGGVLWSAGRPTTNETPPVSTVTATWSAAGTLDVARPGASATVLADGRVLIVGGGPDGLDSAVIWDPATGRSEATGSMAHPRTNHAAALLHDGRVLVVGGVLGRIPIDEVEVWDPVTGAFAVVGTMPAARLGGTDAVVLPDGRVLISDSVDCPSNVEAADACDGVDRLATDLFDPASGFTPGPRMVDDRQSTTVSLGDGSVLFVGLQGYQEPAHASVYDWESEAFADGGQTPEAWSGLSSATALTPSRASEPRETRQRVLLIFDGVRARVWDSTAGFEEAGALSTTRLGHAAILLPDGRVLIAGGRFQNDPLATTEIWDPTTSAFSAGPAMTVPRSYFSLTALPDGRALAIGGDEDGGRSIEILE